MPMPSSGSSLPPSSDPPSRYSSPTVEDSDPARKRVHSPVDEDEVGPHGRKRRKSPATPWRDWGRTCARVVDAYTDPKIIINTYLKALMPGTSDAFSDMQQRVLESYTLLTKHIPALGEYVSEAPVAKFKELFKELKEGQNSARQADTNSLKYAIVDMIRLQFPESPALCSLDRKNKALRGFRNDLTGELLCPTTLDWSDDSVREKLRAAPNLASTTSWPRFFYPKDRYNPTDIAEGLLRGELLAYKLIYTGPSSWDKPDGISRNSRYCNARLAEMQQVTCRSLAYVATQTRFALSSGETNQKVGGPFDNTHFFWHLVKFLEDPDFEEEVQDLLHWWNSRLFPGEDELGSNDKTMDSLALLKTQKAAKRAALQNATNCQHAGPPAILAEELD
ncbi:hypothetical protein JB92DRAFT_3110608 [Gautieria morchelliformis]|nr:hypothetical protein JB92DRAFT_3110608 [Gautieria morchelliformis]